MSSHKDLISIIIPTRDRPEYLKDAIESAIAQTYPKKEIFVIDGGKDPRTYELCKNYNVKYIRNPKRNTASAFNIAINEMNGEWFKWLSDDDYLAPNALYELLEANGEIVYGEYYRVNPEKKILQKFKEPSFKTWEEFAFAMYDHHIGNGSASIIHKSCFDKVGKFDESLEMHEDYDWWMRAAIVAKIKFKVVHKAICFYRVHPGQLTFERQAKAMEINKVIREKLRLSVDDGYWEWFDREQKIYNKKPLKKRFKIFIISILSHLPAGVTNLAFNIRRAF